MLLNSNSLLWVSFFVFVVAAVVCDNNIDLDICKLHVCFCIVFFPVGLNG